MERGIRILRDAAITLAALGGAAVAAVHLTGTYRVEEQRDDKLAALIECDGTAKIPWSEGYGVEEVIKALQDKCGITDEQIEAARKGGFLPR